MKLSRNRSASTNASEESSGSPPVAPPPPSVEKAKRPSRAAASKTSGKKSFTLLIGDEGAILVYMQGATVLRRLFAASAQPDHTSTIAELMRSNPKVPIAVLADVLDQQYVRHTFPPVSKLSIGGLVTRRMERDFNPEDMKAGLPLGRDMTGRKEWQYLIVSLTATPLMQQWLDFLLDLPNEMLGVFLLPVEMQRFIPTLSKTTAGGSKNLPWRLLISNNKVSGFRQIVLHENKLIFTRVSQAVEDAIPAVIAGNLEQEIINTLEYIRRLDFKENDSLEIFVIASQEVVDALDLHRFGAGNSCAFTPLEVATAMKLEQAALSADRFGDVVITASFAAMGKRTLRFANGYMNKLAGMYRGLTAVRLVAAVIICALIFRAISNVSEVFSHRSAISEIEGKKISVHNELVASQKAVDGLEPDITYKLLAVTTSDMYAKDILLPNEFIAELAPLLNPQMRVKRLQWGPPGAFVKGAAAAAPTPATGKPPAAPAAGASTLEIRVDIEVSGQYEDAEKASKAVDQFMANLKAAMPRYDIAVQPYPWAGTKEAPQEIKLDQPVHTEANNPLAEGKNVINLTFVGPKKTDAPAPATPPKPGAP